MSYLHFLFLFVFYFWLLYLLPFFFFFQLWDRTNNELYLWPCFSFEFLRLWSLDQRIMSSNSIFSPEILSSCLQVILRSRYLDFQTSIYLPKQHDITLTPSLIAQYSISLVNLEKFIPFSKLRWNKKLQFISKHFDVKVLLKSQILLDWTGVLIWLEMTFSIQFYE